MERTHNHSSPILTRENPPALRLSTRPIVQYQSEENVNAGAALGWVVNFFELNN
jgi:hypothetical protein